MDFLTEFGEGSSSQQHNDYVLNTQIKVEMEQEINDADLDEENMITMDLLELAACSVQSNTEPMEFDTTHAMLNPKTGLMVCLHCLEDVEKNMLHDHMVNAHAYRNVYFKCRLCNKVFKQRNALTTHKEQCKPQPKRKYRKSFQQIMREIDNLLQQSTIEKMYNIMCPICMVDYDRSVIKEHLTSEHKGDENNTTCDTCHRTFKNRLTLREHIKLVHILKNETEECELCGQKFRSQKYLSNHRRNVHPKGNKEYRCAFCDKPFKSRLCVHQHTKHVHPPQSASVDCQFCGKVFKTKILLGQHLKVSHGYYKKPGDGVTRTVDCAIQADLE